MYTTKLISASGAIILTAVLFLGLAKPVSASTPPAAATAPSAAKSAAKSTPPAAFKRSALDESVVRGWKRVTNANEGARVIA